MSATSTDSPRAARVARVMSWIWSSPASSPDRIRRIAENPGMDDAREMMTALRGGTVEENAERDNGLHDQAHDGDETAALALYGQYMSKIERLAATYGNSDSPVFDTDDAHQEAALALLEILADGRNRKDFAGRFEFEARTTVGDTAALYLHPMQVTRGVARMVMDAVELFDGNLNRASEYLATVPPVGQRVNRERFFSTLYAIDPTYRVELDASDEGMSPLHETIEDPNATKALNAVLGEDGFDNEALETAWARLNDRERQVLSLLTGVGRDAMTEAAAAEILGVTQPRICQIRKSALSKLRTFLGA